MKDLFNGKCDACLAFLPRCATVYLRLQGKATKFNDRPVVLCEGCRKLPNVRGTFRLDVKHR